MNIYIICVTDEKTKKKIDELIAITQDPEKMKQLVKDAGLEDKDEFKPFRKRWFGK